MNKGFLLVISGPSGSGKGTVVSRLLEMDDRFTVSVSATTRAPREGEEHGRHYYFIDKAEFERRIGSDMMLEWAEYCGNYYGTPGREVSENLEAGRNVILEIEVAGAAQIHEKFPEAILIMLLPPSFSEQDRRLRDRKTETEEAIQKRLSQTREEMKHIDLYDYIVYNETGKPEEAAKDILSIVRAERCARRRNPNAGHAYFK